MEKSIHVRNPIEWAATHVHGLSRARPPELSLISDAIPVPRALTIADLRASLSAGLDDFLAFRSDVIVLCFMYPVAGALLWRFATGYNMLHLLFPLIGGFALVGPLFATGLYEMSRQHERGLPVTWPTAFEAFRTPAIIRILGLGIVSLAIFGAWLLVAHGLYAATVEPMNPGSVSDFVHDVLFTAPGRVMIVAGMAIGFLFAALVLCTSLVSYPMLLDRTVTMRDAVQASITASRANPQMVALWGLIVAVGLGVGAVPFLVGLIITVPVLGHATWHLYRRVYG
jgi:uncharacterized membrane protein